MTQEFYISVTPVGEDGYLVRTEWASPGVPVAEELVTWKVEEWLDQAGQLMHDPLLGLLRGNLLSLGNKLRSSQALEGDTAALSPNLVEFGQTLYNALFQGTVRDSWMTAQGIAQNRREELRLRLGLKGDRLPRLPWEVLHAGDRPLATGTDVIFSRYQSAFAPMATVLQTHRSPTPEVDQPLRILMVLAAPTDQEVLALKQEANHLKEELQRELHITKEPLPAIELTILEQPGREQLTQALEQGRYQVLHYAGHSNLGASGGDLYLVSDKTGLTEILSGDDLAGLLVNNGIRMAVFNSCRGVYTAAANLNGETEAGNLTEALLKRGVPAVLAMAERIPDDVALTLSRLFYRNLKQRYPIDLSLSRARQGLLSAYGSNQLYWALPILYLHPDFDGYLQAKGNSPVDASLDPVSSAIDDFEFEDPEAFLDDVDYGDLEYESDQSTIQDLFRELSGTGDTTPIHDHSGSDAATRSNLPSDLSAHPTPQTHRPINAAPRTAEEHLHRGQTLRAQGDLAGAIAAYGEAIETDPNCAEAYSQMGAALEAYDSSKIAEAIIAYRMAVQLDPTLEAPQQHLRRLLTAHNIPASAEHREPPANAANITAPTAEPPRPAVERVFAQPLPRSLRRPWVAIGLVGAATAAIIGAVWGTSKLLSFNSQPDDMLSRLPAIEQPVGNPANVSKDDTNTVTALASKNFSQGNLRVGQQAVEALLDRNALTAAETALQAVPADKLDNPAISFLRGRLAWQFIQTGNRNYNPEDARRYWETAVKGKRDPFYYNALGFAYYREGNLNRASDAWFQSLYLIEEQRKNQGSKVATPSQDTLTAYAGLALTAIKSAPKQPRDKQTRLKGEAVKLRDRVLKAAPANFQPNALAKNWLWSQAAIADWQALRAIK